MIVTIDGPAGTGKSTVARMLANLLGFQFLDTGAMYRMVAFRTIAEGIDPANAETVEELTHRLRMELVNGTILLDGENVESHLRSPDVTRIASFVAQIPMVREELVHRQRSIADSHDIVCEGRDQGTVAFPHAEHKFFLTADPAERARRRKIELEARGATVDFEELLREQSARDRRDAERAVAPLKPATDAHVIDTTELDIQAVVIMLREHVLGPDHDQMAM